MFEYQVSGEPTAGSSTPVMVLLVLSRRKGSSGNTPPNADQDTTGCLCCEGTLLAHGQPGVHQDL